MAHFWPRAHCDQISRFPHSDNGAVSFSGSQASLPVREGSNPTHPRASGWSRVPPSFSHRSIPLVSARMSCRISGISEELEEEMMETDLGHNYTAAMEDLDDATQPAPPHDGLFSLRTAQCSSISYLHRHTCPQVSRSTVGIQM